jgi:hypothetical protein
MLHKKPLSKGCGIQGDLMTLQVLPSSAWREFRGFPGLRGLNQTSHFALVEGSGGKLHKCFLKLIDPSTPGLLCEALGWAVAQGASVPTAEFACIVFVPVDELKKHVALPSWLTGLSEAPAWCTEVITGDSVAQVHKWLYAIRRKRCLNSIDTHAIAAFDVWSDNADRHMGNVMRSSSGGYVAIDHETLLHEMLWIPSGRRYTVQRLVDAGKTFLGKSAFKTFFSNMHDAAGTHNGAMKSVEKDIRDIVATVVDPVHALPLANAIVSYLGARSAPSWFPANVGVTA